MHPTQWTSANPVGADQPAKGQKKPSCVSIGRTGLELCICQVVHRTSFLSRQCDFIASFSFGMRYYADRFLRSSNSGTLNFISYSTYFVSILDQQGNT